ncbi:hypothetical protein STEG23_013824 [Scotinomys teguina]
MRVRLGLCRGGSGSIEKRVFHSAPPGSADPELIEVAVFSHSFCPVSFSLSSNLENAACCSQTKNWVRTRLPPYAPMQQMEGNAAAAAADSRVGSRNKQTQLPTVLTVPPANSRGPSDVSCVSLNDGSLKAFEILHCNSSGQQGPLHGSTASDSSDFTSCISILPISPPPSICPCKLPHKTKQNLKEKPKLNKGNKTKIEDKQPKQNKKNLIVEAVVWPIESQFTP